MVNTPIIYWFRQDLRLRDLPGLAAAAATGRPVLPVYVQDNKNPSNWQPGAASRWWLHQSLAALSGQLSSLSGQLTFFSGDPASIIPELARQVGASDVYCSKQYEPWARRLESKLSSLLIKDDIKLKPFHGTLLWNPTSISNKSGQPYKVFTPFWRTCREAGDPEVPAGSIKKTRWHKSAIQGESLTSWNLQPAQPDWAAHWGQIWQPGEEGAMKRLQQFLADSLRGYGNGRDFPAMQSTSRLSAHLHFGEIAPNRVYHTLLQNKAMDLSSDSDTDKFLSELGWREFSYHLLHHFPHIPEREFKAGFAKFPWSGSAQQYSAWKAGKTGYPIVDAGMRELYATGTMHNRVRMVVASFLCKHLLIDWRAGQRWFWDTLVDADLASNSCSWQWVAGSGADAAPYYRIFNPVTQSRKFDANGAYIRRWAPELTLIPDRYIHDPWTAPQEVLEEFGFALGVDYPCPIVDHPSAREDALAAYAQLKSQHSSG